MFSLTNQKTTHQNNKMTKITILKNKTILIGNSDVFLIQLIKDAMKLYDTTIDKQMIVTEDEVVERLKEMIK